MTTKPGERPTHARRDENEQSPAVPTASVLDTARMLANPVVPFFARGPFARRRRVVWLVQRLDLDARAVQTLAKIRDRYDGGPVRMRIPGRPFTFLLEPDQAHRVLEESPVPFSVSTVEKRLGLGHYQPEGLIISPPGEREGRRPFNEAVLEEGSTVHRLSGPLTGAMREEMAEILDRVRASGELTWDEFAPAWWRGIRRAMLGATARYDEEVTDELLRLRNDANWVYLVPPRRRAKERFLSRLEQYVRRAEPDSLARLVAETEAAPGTVKHEQMVQWLFASDGASVVTWRALALLAAHPEAARRARAEMDGTVDLPFLRACMLESARLWPVVPAILRDTTEETRWNGTRMPAGTPLILFAPFFHRDDTRFPAAHRFEPDLWLRPRTDQDWPLVPFSGGPAMCPGRNLALLLGTSVLAALLEGQDWRTEDPRLGGPPLPGTLSHFHLRFSPTGVQ